MLHDKCFTATLHDALREFEDFTNSALRALGQARTIIEAVCFEYSTKQGPEIFTKSVIPKRKVGIGSLRPLLHPGPYKLSFSGTYDSATVFVIAGSGEKIRILNFSDRRFFFALAEAKKVDAYVSYDLAATLYEGFHTERKSDCGSLSSKRLCEIAYQRVSKTRRRLESMGVDPRELFCSQQGFGYQLICDVLGWGSVKSFPAGNLLHAPSIQKAHELVSDAIAEGECCE